MIPIIQNNNIMLHVTCYVLRESRGYALLLAILVTSAVLAGATAFASIVISEIRQTREISDAIAARAVAEGDIEQALFVLRKGNEKLLDDASLLIEKEYISPARPFVIAENDFVSLPVPFNFAGSVTIPVWETATGCAGSWIEVSTVSWGGESGFSTYRHPYSRSDAEPPASISIPISENTVELRIRALYCDITSLRVNNLRSRIKIASTAEVQGANQTVEVIVSRTMPTSGLFDFVIFSECSIIKGTGDPICP